jgi:hypothetical protein
MMKRRSSKKEKNNKRQKTKDSSSSVKNGNVQKLFVYRNEKTAVPALKKAELLVWPYK